MPVDTDLLPPRYREAERIGRGGMGEIFRVRDDTLGREVAVKLLAERYAADEDVRSRFTREALAAARLSGERHVVTIFDVGEWHERPFIVMEHMPGGSLEDVLRREGAQPPGRALEWLEQAASALDAAHAHGVVHRDVKPANLLLDRNGAVNVADFGIATAAGMESFTRPGTILGTAGYLAPEQAQAAPAGAAADRYALAVVAFELLTGSRPFAADSPTAEAAAHVNAPVPPISRRRPDLPAELDAVFERGLAKDPEDRFPSAGALVAAIRDAFDRASGTTRVGAAAVPAAPAPPARPAPPPPAQRRSRGLPILLALLVLGTALAGIALAATLVRDGDPDRATPPASAPSMQVTTVVTTAPGTTEVVTTTAPAPTESEPPPPTEPGGGDASGAALNDEGFQLMQQGDYEGALPLLEQAVAQLRGSGSLAEAYADYNLAYTRLQLGRCEGVPGLLNRSEQVQGSRSEIDEARQQHAEVCG